MDLPIDANAVRRCTRGHRNRHDNDRSERPRSNTRFAFMSPPSYVNRVVLAEAT